jgi:type II secretory pathway pseudopilin PulG
MMKAFPCVALLAVVALFGSVRTSEAQNGSNQQQMMQNQQQVLQNQQTMQNQRQVFQNQLQTQQRLSQPPTVTRHEPFANP